MDDRGRIPARISIEHRLAVWFLDGRTRLEDWEGDTLPGVRHQGAIVTLVERKSRLTLAALVDHRNKACVQQANRPPITTSGDDENL